jgi:lysophospholipase L1-like esterase
MTRSRSVSICAVLAGTLLAGCQRERDNPTGPTPLPQPNSTINYSALGASDAIGVGASIVFIPFFDCPDGRGYVQLAARELRARGFIVNLTNLGFPAMVLSRRLQDLGAQYGRDIPGNLREQQAPFVKPTDTLVTVFAGANDVDTIIAAVGGGAGGSNQTAFLNSQIQAFADEFAGMMRMIRERAPTARVVVLNLPNMAGMPRLASASAQHRRAAQILSVGINTSAINPFAAQGGAVLDLMCDPRSYHAATYSADGFHPSDTGYAWMAAEVVSAATTAYRSPAASCSQMTIVN